MASSPFFQKLGSDVPDVKHPTPAGKRYVMEVCKSGVIRYRDTVTGRFVMDPFKNVHASLSDPTRWYSELRLMKEWYNAAKASAEAQSIRDAIAAGLKEYLKNKGNF